MRTTVRKAFPVIQIGIWQRAETFDIVWFDQRNQAHFLNTDGQSLAALPQMIADRIFGQSANSGIRFKFITAIPAHHIWHKTLILPQQLNSQECEQQCRFILENELPVSLHELWFDYCSAPLKQGLRLDIFAVMQQIAASRLEALSPLSIEVLDNAAHCMLRAFDYLLPAAGASALFLYQDTHGCLALQDKAHQLQLVQKTSQNLTALFTQYCERYQEKPERIVVYRTPEHAETLPTDWQIIRTELPFIALGAALWRRDLRQDESLY